MLIVELFFFLSGFSSLILIHLILQKASKHIFLVIHAIDSFFLFFSNSSLKLIHLFFFKVVPLLLSISITDGCFIFIDVLSSILIF